MKKQKKNLGAYGVRPSIYTNFMTTHIFFSEDIWILKATRTNHEESSFNIFWSEVIEEFPIRKT